MESIELGGLIELQHFAQLDSNELTIVKKIVGQYVKSLSTSDHEVRRLVLVHEKVGPAHQISADLSMDGQTHKSAASDRNFFFAVSQCLEGLA